VLTLELRIPREHSGLRQTRVPEPRTVADMGDNEETQRLASSTTGAGAWRQWGPYVSERAWGSVREDYSADGDAWNYFPFEHARSRAYRWNEDGMAAICDLKQNLCLGLALWNGVDPILKERMFGLSGPQGNHGEDAKDYWWYLDSTPTHSWMTWRYHYPQGEFPYADLAAENARRGRTDAEYELIDTGIFDEGKYWVVTVDFAKAGPDDICMRITVENAGPDEAAIHVLPTLWCRNTWSWGRSNGAHPELTLTRPGLIQAAGPEFEAMALSFDPAAPAWFCDNETNTERVFGTPGTSPYPKDGINDAIVHGAPTINPDNVGTKASVHHLLVVPAGEQREVRVRLRAGFDSTDLGSDFQSVMRARKAEADTYYRELAPELPKDEALVMRQAFAGLMWGKQFFHYDVETWLEGDPAFPPPPAERRAVRNSAWRNFSAADVISMPDPWEYPWFAAWDLAFHCIPLSHVDPAFAKHQLLLMLREWYMHPNGQLPAYEWKFEDVNPPVHAWAALSVFHGSGDHDYTFLEQAFHKLLLNFSWWVNRKDSQGANVFEGGFLGLDNIGAFDRSSDIPSGGYLAQSDGTAWMAFYCLNMLEIAIVLAEHDESYEPMATKFYEHFAYIATAAHDQGLWDEADAFFYDVLVLPDGERIPLRIRSLVGLLPLIATITLDQRTLDRLPSFARDIANFERFKPQLTRNVSMRHMHGASDRRLLSVLDPDSLLKVVRRLLADDEFLSPFGIRSLSKEHQDHPFQLDLPGLTAVVNYEPGESQTNLFGGNSNWRGPLWFPSNYLIIGSLRRFAEFLGPDQMVELPTGSGRQMTLEDAAEELEDRLTQLFLRDQTGRRPVFGDVPMFQDDPRWRDNIWFYEYFHGDTGAGLGAAHQTGWTALVAESLLHHREGAG